MVASIALVSRAACALALVAVHTQVSNAEPERVRFVRGFVIDSRLSVLRREPALDGRVLQRLRLGRAVYVYGARGNPRFHRVAISRRTRGWIHAGAVAIPGRAGEDHRVFDAIRNDLSGIDRLVLCRIFIEHFSRSPLMPRVMLELGEEAERAAATITRLARKRLGVGAARDLYMSDPALDRYSKLEIRFILDESAGEFVYDGQIYRELIRRFPRSAEAVTARLRLEQIRVGGDRSFGNGRAGSSVSPDSV